MKAKVLAGGGRQIFVIGSAGNPVPEEPEITTIRQFIRTLHLNTPWK